MARIVVGLYDQIQDAEQVIKDLVNGGFDRKRISLISKDGLGKEAPNDAAGNAGSGSALGELAGMKISLSALNIPGIGPVLAAGPLTTRFKEERSGAANGSLLGALKDVAIPESHAYLYIEGLRRGGSLVTVSVLDSDAKRAVQFMNRYNPVDIERMAVQMRTGHYDDIDDIEDEFPREALDRERFHIANRLGKKNIKENEQIFFQREARNGRLKTPPNHNEATVDEPISQKSKMASLGGHQVTGFDEFEPIFRRHYQETYSGIGQPFDRYREAYLFGFDLGIDDHYTNRKWQDFEDEARQDWEDHHPTWAWEDYHHAIYEGWNVIAGMK